MEDLGDPASYLTLKPGTPVLSSDGQRIGVIEHVLAEAEMDVFEGLVIDSSTGAGGHRFADADQISAIHERGVVLALDTAAAGRLPEPSENPAAMGAQPDDAVESDLQRKLRRAWDYISGRY